MAAQGFSPLWFVLAVSYPALALTKVRSFSNTAPRDDPLARSVINEAGLARRALFLNLNYHAVHHDLPGSLVRFTSTVSASPGGVSAA